MTSPPLDLTPLLTSLATAHADVLAVLREIHNTPLARHLAAAAIALADAIEAIDPHAFTTQGSPEVL